MCWGHNVGAQAQCRGTINLWGQFVGAQCGGTACRAPTNCCHLLPFHAILCHPMPCPTMGHNQFVPLDCCHLLHNQCPVTMWGHGMPAPKFRKPTQWWEHSGGGIIEGIIWEHNVGTLWGYNGANVGAHGHNVGAQSICGGTMPCPHNHPMPSHATIPCYHPMLPPHAMTHHMPCPYHAMTPTTCPNPYRSAKPGQWVLL
jgi:hypothetical protein